MLPTWIKHRDGRLAPFDGDDLSRDLYAAAQTLGPVDAFLIRELTDGILHFLSQEELPAAALIEQIDEIAEKVLVQFGHANLAAALLSRRSSVGDQSLTPAAVTLTFPFDPAEAPAAALERFSEAFALKAAYSPDVAAAHEQGLIRIGGLRHFQHLETVSVPLEPFGDCEPFDVGWNVVVRGQAQAGQTLIVDGPEWSIRSALTIAAFVRGLDRAAEAYDRNVDVHLNSPSPPWEANSGAMNGGPLFDDVNQLSPSPVEEWLDAILTASPRIRPVWRRTVNDDSVGRRLASSQRNWRVAFERKGHPIAISHGITRTRPAVLATIGVDLPRLLNRPEISCQAEAFLSKLPSLVRLAASAGAQKRAFLKRHSRHLASKFLLDRAAVRIEPLGLGKVLEQLMGVSAPITKPVERLAEAILNQLADPLRIESRRLSLELLGTLQSEIAFDQPGALPNQIAGITKNWGGDVFANDRNAVCRGPADGNLEMWMEAVQIAAEATALAGLDIVRN